MYKTVIKYYYQMKLKLKFSPELNEISKINQTNKEVTKKYFNQFRSVLTDFYRVYLSLMESYSELEDLFSNIIKYARKETGVIKVP